MKRKLVLLVSMALSQLWVNPSAHAAAKYVYLDDVSRLEYQMGSDGVVWFRNLNEFDGAVTGCCYAFYLDTTTGAGKNIWALILMKMASAGSLHVHVTEANPPASGNPAIIDQAGNW
jgi:hypothetical protein